MSSTLPNRRFLGKTCLPKANRLPDLYGRIINAITGELLRELTINPDRDYQPTGPPKGPTRK
jgi:hypothetical protein